LWGSFRRSERRWIEARERFSPERSFQMLTSVDTLWSAPSIQSAVSKPGDFRLAIAVLQFQIARLELPTNLKFEI
jgi:hypothetical protein